MKKSLLILNSKLVILIYKKKLMKKIYKILILMNFNPKNREIFKNLNINLIIHVIKILKIFKTTLTI